MTTKTTGDCEMTPEAIDALIKRLRKTVSSGRQSHLSKADRLLAADTITALRAPTPVDPVTEAARVRSQAIREFCDKAGITPIQEVKGLPDDVKRWRMESVVAARRAELAQETPHDT